MNYNPATRRYFDNPPGVGELAGEGIIRASAGNREEGAFVQLTFKIGERRIEDARFLAVGCPHLIAMAAWLTERAVQAPVQMDLPDSQQHIRERFDLPVEKVGRLLLLEDAWRAAMRQALASDPR